MELNDQLALELLEQLEEVDLGGLGNEALSPDFSGEIGRFSVFGARDFSGPKKLAPELVGQTSMGKISGVSQEAAGRHEFIQEVEGRTLTRSIPIVSKAQKQETAVAETSALVSTEASAISREFQRHARRYAP